MNVSGNLLFQNWGFYGVKRFKPHPQNMTLVPLRGALKIYPSFQTNAGSHVIT